MKQLIHQHISSFCGDKAAGNQHFVALVSELSPTENIVEQSIACAPKIFVELCVNSHRFRAFHHGKEVSFCGSGILAANYALRLASPEIQDAIVFHCKLNQVKAMVGAMGYGFAISKVEIAPAPEGAKFDYESIIGRVPAKLSLVFLAEDKRTAQYVIAEVRNNESLAQLQPQLAHLKNLGGPALIVTSRVESNRYEMRYFAPQFGNDEDIATGSANAILIQYWFERTGIKQWHGWQASATGGEFYGEISGGEIELYGKVKEIKDQEIKVKKI